MRTTPWHWRSILSRALLVVDGVPKSSWVLFRHPSGTSPAPYPPCGKAVSVKVLSLAPSQHKSSSQTTEQFHVEEMIEKPSPGYLMTDHRHVWTTLSQQASPQFTFGLVQALYGCVPVAGRILRSENKLPVSINANPAPDTKQPIANHPKFGSP